MALSDDELDRYARQLVLREVGGAGQAKLAAAHVVVIGAGGIGCPALACLAAAGVGRITVIDDDVVALSNLQRQVLFATADIGRAKVAVVAERLGALNPHVAVTGVRRRIDATNAGALIAGASVVVDGCDNFATRLAVSDASVRGRVPLVSAAIGMFQGQIGSFRGWEPEQSCYRCFVGDAFDADDCDSCAELGVLGATAGVMGSWAALEALRVIVGFGEDRAGSVQVFDALGATLRRFRVVKDVGCGGCGQAQRRLA